MTSKNWYFKLMKEDLKRRLWAVALIGLVLFFTYPVAAAYMAEDIMEYSDIIEARLEYKSVMVNMLSFQNGWTVFCIFCTAVLCAVSGFSYLNSKSKVDFYHSIPVRREKLFCVKFINGILIPAFWYLVWILVAVAIAVGNGLGLNGKELLLFGLRNYALHMLYYSLLYATAVTAMMMTGNKIVGMLGMGVFFSYGPMITMIVTGCFSVWFSSFSNSSHMIEKVAIWSSPFSIYMYALSEIEEGRLKEFFPIIFFAGLLVLALTAVAFLLYRKRPSEAAGKAMAFQKSAPVIRILLVIANGLGGGLFGWGMRENMFWTVFMAGCGVVISHCVIEIIYHFDFRKLFSHVYQLFGCLAATVLVLCAFRYDVFGYDRYLPKAGQVSSAAINVTDLDNWLSYSEIVTKEDGINPYLTREYGSRNSYIFESMYLTDPQAVLDIASAGIERIKQERQDGNIRGYYTYDDIWPDDDSGYKNKVVTVKILYRMKSGRKVSREYRFMVGEIGDALEKLYGQEGFKEGMYPIFESSAKDFVQATFRNSEDAEAILLSSAGVSEFYSAYLEDFKAQTAEDRKKEDPIGQIAFWSQDELNYWKQQGTDYVRYSNAENYYPIYPSFQKTISLLEKQGIDVWNDFAGGVITGFWISRNYEKYETNPGLSRWFWSAFEESPKDAPIQTREDVEYMKQKLVQKSMANLNLFSSADRMFLVCVEYKTGEKEVFNRYGNSDNSYKNDHQTYYYFKKDQLPEELQEVKEEIKKTEKSVK